MNKNLIVLAGIKVTVLLGRFNVSQLKLIILL